MGLRFLIFNTAGRIVHHARRLVCRLTGEGWLQSLELMPLRLGGLISQE
jgi:hypothetical protein